MRLLATTLLAALIPAASLAQTTAPAAETTAPAAADAAAPAAATMPGAPPAGSMKLSEVIAALEGRVGAELAYIEDVDWDDDGYWEVEYRTTSGEDTEVKLDPATGEARN